MLAIALPLDRNDVGMVRQTVDQGDRTGRVRKDRVPLLEEQIGSDDDRALFVATTDDLKEQVGRVGLFGALRRGLAYLLGNARRAHVDRDRRTGRLRAGLSLVEVA